MPEYTISSEIYEEYSYLTKIPPTIEGNVVSEFPFFLPKRGKKKFDRDGDLDINKQKEAIRIEHRPKTRIALVGLQVWRGAFLSGDLLITLGEAGKLKDKTVLELGAGTGLASIVASMYAKKVVCTDLETGGILDLIKLNVTNNEKFVKSDFQVMALDFMDRNWNESLSNAIIETDIIIAADVIYDDDVTEAFIYTIEKILNSKPPKTLYIILEKRYVFTVEHRDSVAPCYETFISLLDKVKHSNWLVQQMPINFVKYFTYYRVEEFVIWKISSVE
ncbi:methyltransferase-like protein 22 [Aricia agestis]|uniref:methyltransferase-like protein 22 n=1 Tax=Aricia agestis TaxID=91739 RepID=UPI001C2068F7|nr:methyltransferase-like protein 22 [Aricia agestis]